MNKKRILLEPNDNSIAYTAKNMLENEFDIVEENPDRILICSDDCLSYDKGETEFRFKNKFYYPSPEKNTICIKKPIDGSGGKGITFDVYKKNSDDFVYQKYINGDEYSVDCWYYDGQLKNFAVRKRGKIWNGISMHSTFTNEFDEEIEILLKDIIKGFTAVDVEHGLMVVQFMRDKNKKFWLLEINPRPCANQCYGKENNFILNYIKASFGMKYNIEKIKCKEINRFLGYEVK